MDTQTIEDLTNLVRESGVKITITVPTTAILMLSNQDIAENIAVKVGEALDGFIPDNIKPEPSPGYDIMVEINENLAG